MALQQCAGQLSFARENDLRFLIAESLRDKQDYPACRPVLQPYEKWDGLPVLEITGDMKQGEPCTFDQYKAAIEKSQTLRAACQ